MTAASVVTVTISAKLWIILLALLLVTVGLLALVQRLPPRGGPTRLQLPEGSRGVIVTKEQLAAFRTPKGRSRGEKS